MTGDPLGLKGTVVDGKYLLGEAAGEGGAAVVYRAENTVWKVPVAVKFFVALSQAPPAEQPALIEAFTQEGRLVADLSTKCSAIVQPRDFGVLRQQGKSPIPYLVLEWLDGRSLDDVLVRETDEGVVPRTLDGSMKLLEPVATALALAHARGIAHRDIKPENMIVIGDPRGQDAQIKLLDFGIAKVMRRRLEGVHQTGTVPTAFTPYYGAPEQFSRAYGETGPWTDVFALALVLLEVMRGGRRAFTGDDYTALAQQSMDETARPTPRRLKLQVGDDIEAAFGRALAVKPEHRYQDVRSFWTALVGAVKPNAPAWRPVGLSIPPEPSSSQAVVASAAPRRSIVAIAAVGGVALIAAAAISAGVRAARAPAASASAPGSAEPVVSAPSSAAAPASASAALPPAALCPTGSVVAAGGRFIMGAAKEDLEAASPEHIVYVDTFCIDEVEVTVGEYRACVDAGRCPSPAPPASADKGCHFGGSGGDKLPMNCVSWGEASALCSARKMRLPTEAEWELAASKAAAKALGDGVAEWVNDYYAPYTEEQAVNPMGPDTGTTRVVRGGAPPDIAAKHGTRFREGSPLDRRRAGLGFRCARAIE